MIKVFSPTDRSFSSNGDVILKPYKAIVHKQDNGDYYLSIEAGLEYADALVEGNIIVAPTPQGEQAFRITNPLKTKTKITVKAWHVFYDSKNYLIEDSYVVDKNCNNALIHLNNATRPQSPFSVSSDIGTTNSYRCVRNSLYEAFSTVLDRWGGHLIRDNFNVQIKANIGVDNGVTVQYKKNLKDISCEERWDNVVTELLPVGKDGILLNELNPSASKYVTSEIQYEIPYTKTVSFTQESVIEDDYSDETAYKRALINDLREQAESYVETHCIPEVNYSLKANIEKLTDIGDVIEVKDSRLGINLMTNVIAFDYDCILGQYREVEFGNFKNTLSGLVSNITASVNKETSDRIDSAIGQMESSLEQAKDQIIGAFGDSYVIYDGNEIFVVDSLPKEDAQNVIKINYNGISFSSTGIDGTFLLAWSVDGTLNMENVNVINLMADMVKGGTFRRGSRFNSDGVIELYDYTNTLICTMDQNGLKASATDGSFVLFDEGGVTGFDCNLGMIFWINGDEFHVQKPAVEKEVILFSKAKILPITIEENGQVINDGIGLFKLGG